MNRPYVEEIPARIRPVRQRLRQSLAWLGARGVVVGILFLGAVFLGVMYLILQDAGSFSHRRIDFPPVPQLDAAIASAQERLKVNPQDIGALVELGTLHFEKGKDFYPDGINELEDARDLGALDPRIFYCLGIMYQEVGLYPFALEEYKRFLRHYPDDKEIRMLEAKLLYKQGSFTEAVSEYERLRFHYPNDALVEENLGLSLWGAKAVDRAVEVFGSLKTRGGDEAKRAEFYLGQIAFDQGKLPEAVEHLQRAQPEGAAAIGIPSEKVHAALALAYQKAGLLAEAKDAWQKVLVDVPGDAKAQSALRDVNRRLQPRRRSKTGRK